MKAYCASRPGHVRRSGNSLAPVSDAQPTGDDPGYDDDFQRIREEVNKISGVDTVLICQLAGQLLATTKDIRIVTYYCWARLHQTGKLAWPMGWSCWQACCNDMVCSFIRSATVAAKQPSSGWRVLVS